MKLYANFQPSEQQKDKPRMSAKQKRELKKQQRKQQNNADDKQDVPDGFDLTDVRKNKVSVSIYIFFTFIV